MAIRLFLDEHIHPAVAGHLRRLGYDVLTTSEAGRASQKFTDEEQLAFASAHGRVILTHDADDYPDIDARWKAQGREHAGILLADELPVSSICRRVEAHLKRHTAEEHHNLLLWLGPADH